MARPWVSTSLHASRTTPYKTIMMSTLIAVTGNIASGKSRVAELLRERCGDTGCALIDADKLAHELYGRDAELVRDIARALGDDVLRPDGSLDRSRTGQKVFGNPAALAALNAIVHPKLLAELRARIAETRMTAAHVIVDAALIFEWGIRDEFDHVILVTAPEDVRVARLIARSGLSREDALARVRSQMPEEEKRKRATVVIENGGDEEGLRGKVNEVWDIISNSGR